MIFQMASTSAYDGMKFKYVFSLKKEKQSESETLSQSQ